MEDIIDDLTDLRCDRCRNRIRIKDDLREAFIYAGVEEKTHFLSNTERYSLKKNPFPFTICKACADRSRRNNFLVFIIGIAIGGIIMLLPFDYSGMIGFVIIGLMIYAAMDTDFSKNGSIDEVGLKQFDKKYPEEYVKGSTRLFTRNEFKKMYPVYSVNTEKFMEDIRKRNEEILETLRNMKTKKGSE